MEASALILTPYRKPPYRTPTPKSSVSPPPSHTESPKRKRSDSEASTGDLLLQINTSARDFAPTSGVESPRSKVAEKLRGLQIQALQTPPAQSGDGAGGGQRKRMKRNEHLRPIDGGDESEDDHLEQSRSQTRAFFSRSPSPAEIGETPDCRLPRLPSSLPVSPERIRSLDGLPITQESIEVDRTSERQASQQMLSPPPPTNMEVSPSSLTVPFIFGSSSASMDSNDPSPDQAALTWQDHEITGQDIDTSSPDDDGLGINGIGFRPTPAIAYARSQKRKQQVSEWRAREAREARQRRIERRRGGSRGAAERKSPGVRRCVRFEGMV